MTEPIRYLHLNPLRARLVPDLPGLATYAFSGHAALVGKRDYPWQDTQTVLGHFGPTPRRAQQEYLRFVEAGMGQGRRTEFQGGGLIRSAGGWQAVQALRRGRESYLGDERILGRSDFVEQMRQELDGKDGPLIQRRPALSIEAVIDRVSEAVGVDAGELSGTGRRALVSRARAGVAYVWLEWLGQSGSVAARALGVHPATIYAIARRGQAEASSWQYLFLNKKTNFPATSPTTRG